jgi:hypothetical protein
MYPNISIIFTILNFLHSPSPLHKFPHRTYVIELSLFYKINPKQPKVFLYTSKLNCKNRNLLTRTLWSGHSTSMIRWINTHTFFISKIIPGRIFTTLMRLQILPLES